MSLRAVITHVARLSSETHAVLPIPMLMDTVDVCVRLCVSRETLCMGMGTLAELDKFVHLAAGREATLCIARSEREAVDALRNEMQVRLNRLQRDWWAAGQAFTALTRLLPSELHRDACQLPRLDGVRRRALARIAKDVGDPLLGSAFDQAMDRLVSAQKRCGRAANEVELTRDACVQAQTAFRAGQQSLVVLAQLHVQWQRHVESLQQAMAECLVGEQVLQLLVERMRASPDA